MELCENRAPLILLEGIMVRYSLTMLYELSPESIGEYFDEFVANDGDCYVLYRLHDISARELVEESRHDTHTYNVGFTVNGKLIGVGRVTPAPTRIENGMIGYGIRPSERGNGYAPVMIRMLEEFCNGIGVESPTACIDVNNSKSLIAFERAGFVRTGRVYNWPDNRVAIEMCPKSHTNEF